jgi:NADH:ubiquinone oxidoreductase subunit 5 (subunit L)/multisubunit Na+/H+ antiporter MnhA subunit
MNLLFLTFVFPLIGFLLLSFSRGRFSENLSALIGVGSIGLSAIVTAYVIWQFNVAPPEGGALHPGAVALDVGGRLPRRTSRCTWMVCP